MEWLIIDSIVDKMILDVVIYLIRICGIYWRRPTNKHQTVCVCVWVFGYTNHYEIHKWLGPGRPLLMRPKVRSIRQVSIAMQWYLNKWTNGHYGINQDKQFIVSIPLWLGSIRIWECSFVHSFTHSALFKYSRPQHSHRAPQLSPYTLWSPFDDN